MLQPQPIFSAEEIKENELNKQRFFKVLHSGDGILMAGAGCTASIYGDWQEFVNFLQDEAMQVEKAFRPFDSGQEDFLAFADRVKFSIGPDPYYNLIYRRFKEKEQPHKKFHESLCRLMHKKKLKAITTTNYDPVFENAMTAVTGKLADPIWIDANMEQARIFEFLMSLNDSDSRKRIFHIHGISHQKGSIILSKSEYEDKYGFKLRQPAINIFNAIQRNEMDQAQFSDLLSDYGLVWTIHRKIMWSLFATRRLIFLGFSLSDPYFNKMLEFVSKDLHTYGYDMHFLILRIKDVEEKDRAMIRAKQLKESNGIETIFFEENESNTGLENFVFEMERDMNFDDALEHKAEIIMLRHDLEEDEALTQKLIDESKKR